MIDYMLCERIYMYNRKLTCLVLSHSFRGNRFKHTAFNIQSPVDPHISGKNEFSLTISIFNMTDSYSILLEMNYCIKMT